MTIFLSFFLFWGDGQVEVVVGEASEVGERSCSFVQSFVRCYVLRTWWGKCCSALPLKTKLALDLTPRRLAPHINNNFKIFTQGIQLVIHNAMPIQCIGCLPSVMHHHQSNNPKYQRLALPHPELYLEKPIPNRDIDSSQQQT